MLLTGTVDILMKENGKIWRCNRIMAFKCRVVICKFHEFRNLNLGKSAHAHKKQQKDRRPTYPGGASFVKEPIVSNSTKKMDIKDVECFKCHKNGTYVTNAR